MKKFEVKEIIAKSALVASKIPGVDFVINPYTGCRFACKYCYASFMGRYCGKEITDWGNYVFVKINLPELLDKELSKLKNHGKNLEIFISSVTDPYQGIEVKYRLSRATLELLLKHQFAGTVSVLTKSPLVLRDIDLLGELNALVGLTVTSADDKISRYFETYAPPVSDRFSTLSKLNQAGIRTYAFIGPLLPHVVKKPSQLEGIFANLMQVGTRYAFVEHLNLSSYIRKRLFAELGKTSQELLDEYYSSQTKAYRLQLDKLVFLYAKKYGIKILSGNTVWHKTYKKNENLDKLVKIANRKSKPV